MKVLHPAGRYYTQVRRPNYLFFVPLAKLHAALWLQFVGCIWLCSSQGNGANMKSALMMYERQLDRLSEPVSFNKQVVCVPSYHELWVFYKICKVGNVLCHMNSVR